MNKSPGAGGREQGIRILKIVIWARQPRPPVTRWARNRREASLFSDAFPPIIRSSLGGPVTKITCGLAGQDVQHSHLTKLYAIAIDGPVASGKTAVGRELARRLSISFLDTGVMYRAVTWAALERGIDVGDEQGLSSLAESTHMSLVPGESGDRLMVEGVDVTGHLRDAVVEEHVSQVSAVARVRVALVELQRAIAHQGPIVMVGRDIGTVVLENAEFKAFLQASVDVRAERRHEELIAKGMTADLAQVKAGLAQRDKLDTERAHSPLRPAEDAVIIETDHLGLEEVITRLMSLLGSPR
ncbi:MAG: (d)CMP kinase [Chloroflexi bacterium]|nr:(d)CMP kinase [Chloroflexota bacterium]